MASPKAFAKNRELSLALAVCLFPSRRIDRAGSWGVLSTGCMGLLLLGLLGYGEYRVYCLKLNIRINYGGSVALFHSKW